jgi:hypothetical protein
MRGPKAPGDSPLAAAGETFFPALKQRWLEGIAKYI